MKKYLIFILILGLLSCGKSNNSGRAKSIPIPEKYSIEVHFDNGTFDTLNIEGKHSLSGHLLSDDNGTIAHDVQYINVLK